MSTDDKKKRAGLRAVDFIEDGMIVGLGTGSTAAHFIAALGDGIRDGLKIRGVPTSEQTAELARQAGVPLIDPNDVDGVDVTVDGADEIDRGLRLIKGGGGALLREKIVASASARMIVIADEAKLVAELGAFPLPIEVVPFAWRQTQGRIADVLGAAGVDDAEITLRGALSGAPFVSDGGSYILDCRCGRIPDPDALEIELNRQPGVVENGLFIGLASMAILGEDGGVDVIARS